MMKTKEEILMGNIYQRWNIHHRLQHILLFVSFYSNPYRPSNKIRLQWVGSACDVYFWWI